MKVLMVRTSNSDLGNTGKKPVSGWKNLLRLTKYLKMLGLR